jgi:hypothetical protein
LVKKACLVLALATCASALFADYEVEWSYPMSFYWGPPFAAAPTSTWDLDRDGFPDFFVPDSGRMYVYNGQHRQTAWTVPTPGYEHSDNRFPGTTGNACFVANMDGDPANELILCATHAWWTGQPETMHTEKKIFIYDGTAEDLEFESSSIVGCRFIYVADIDGDGRSEILSGEWPEGSTYGNLVCYGWVSAGLKAASPSAPAPGPARAIPSPARSSIRFSIPGQATGARFVFITDAAGRAIRKLPVTRGPGPDNVVWDCSDDQGLAVPPGTYFYRCGRAEGKLEVVK